MLQLLLAAACTFAQGGPPDYRLQDPASRTEFGLGQSNAGVVEVHSQGTFHPCDVQPTSD